VVIHLENGKTFEITCSLPLTASSTYPGYSYTLVKSAALNNLELQAPHFSFNKIKDGGSLFFQMADGEADAKHFQVSNSYEFAEDVFSDLPLVPRVLLAEADGGKMSKQSRTFSGSMVVLMENDYKTQPYISINNGPFTKSPYLFTLKETSVIRAFSIGEMGVSSDTVQFTYTKIPGNRSIKLNSAYANQYAAGGDHALIDGIRGSDNFRTGSWQGYEGRDIDAVVDLGAVKDIKYVSIGFLQDVNSWIFFPSMVVYYYSLDGKTFTEMETTVNHYTKKESAPFTNDLSTTKIGKGKARYIRIVAKNSGVCPSWHPGNGKPSWIFADEIVVEAK
jgi:hypothetical protein